MKLTEKHFKAFNDGGDEWNSLPLELRGRVVIQVYLVMRFSGIKFSFKLPRTGDPNALRGKIVNELNDAFRLKEILGE